jgi:hypothetical protein
MRSRRFTPTLIMVAGASVATMQAAQPARNMLLIIRSTVESRQNINIMPS